MQVLHHGMRVQVVHLFDDMGIPASYRNMNGSSINTFTLISATGNMTLVRFHWLPLAGEQACTQRAQLPRNAAKPSHCFAILSAPATEPAPMHGSLCLRRSSPAVHPFGKLQLQGCGTRPCRIDCRGASVAQAGERSMLEADICSAAAQAPDGMTATRDLQAAIAAGDFPQYNLMVQALHPARIGSLGFYPLDATKAGFLHPVAAAQHC